MTFSARAKFWFVVVFILVAGFVGGILGNWIFIYLLDKYYGIPGGNYLVAPNSADVVVRDSKPTKETNQFAQTVTTAESSLVGIFKKQTGTAPVYLPKDKIGQGIVMTSDGWIFTPTVLSADVRGASDYVVIANDKTVYEIDRIVTDSVSKLTFIRLQKAVNLPVKEYLLGRELSAGQSVLGLEWKGTIETGVISRLADTVRSSDTTVTPLSITGLGERNVYLFDTSGRIIGYTVGRTSFGMDSVKGLLDKLLSEGKIVRARLGFHYINLGSVANENTVGALVAPVAKEAAVAPGSPADRAGLRTGDIVTAFDGVAINQFSDIAALLLDYNPGDTVTLDILRGTAKRQISITLDTLIQE